MKQVNPSKRLDHLQRAREHFINFLTQCHCYHVAEFQLPQTKNNSAENNTASTSMAYPNLVAMASQRQAKIERWVNNGCNLRAAVLLGVHVFVCVCACGLQNSVCHSRGSLLNIGHGKSKLSRVLRSLCHC